jgi:hypothetical protein
MKNIFIVEDEKNKGEFFIGKKDGKFFYLNGRMSSGGVLKACHVYITSDDYIGYSYYLDGDLVRKGVIDDKEYWSVRKEYKKIIMTTNPKLIKDGVQPIPEEFLKWLVENSSCEYVEVYNDKNVGYPYDHYSIITPTKVSRCCGRCNGVDDLCFTDMCCDDHQEYGCEICYGKRVVYVSEKCTCRIGEPYNNLCCKVHGSVYPGPNDNIQVKQIKKLADDLKDREPKDDFDFSLDGFKKLLKKKYDDTEWDTEKIIDLIQFLSMNEDFNGYSSVSRHTAKYFLEEFKKQ